MSHTKRTRPPPARAQKKRAAGASRSRFSLSLDTLSALAWWGGGRHVPAASAHLAILVVFLFTIITTRPRLLLLAVPRAPPCGRGRRRALLRQPSLSGSRQRCDLAFDGRALDGSRSGRLDREGHFRGYGGHERLALLGVTSAPSAEAVSAAPPAARCLVLVLLMNER